MKLKSVFENQEQYKEVYEALNKKLDFRHRGIRASLFKKLSTRDGYGHTVYNGILAKGIEFTPLELAMVLDGGYGWFGGSVQLDKDGSFICEIQTD